MISSLYTGEVIDLDCFKGNPPHLRNTGFSAYLRKALIETLKEYPELYGEDLNHLAVVDPKYRFKDLVRESQRIFIETKINKIYTGLNIHQEMIDEGFNLLATLDEKVVPCGRRSSRIERGIILPNVFDIARLIIQESAHLQRTQLEESGIPAFMVVASANYKYLKKFDESLPLKLKSQWGELERGILILDQQLCSGTPTIAKCESRHAFRGEYERGTEFNEEIRRRAGDVENTIEIPPAMLKEILDKYNDRKKQIILTKVA